MNRFFLWMRHFLQCQCSHIGKDVEVHVLHITLYMLHHTTKLSSQNREMAETTHTNICWNPSLCLPLLWRDLAHILFDVRGGAGALAWRLIDYAYFPLKKFGSLSIKLWCNALPMTTFEFAFHILSISVHPISILLSQNVHSLLQHSLVKILNIESHRSIALIFCENGSLFQPFWPLKKNISFFLYCYLTWESYLYFYLTWESYMCP